MELIKIIEQLKDSFIFSKTHHYKNLDLNQAAILDAQIKIDEFCNIVEHSNNVCEFVYQKFVSEVEKWKKEKIIQDFVAENNKITFMDGKNTDEIKMTITFPETNSIIA